MQFCDNLREKGPTQCGYKQDVISTGQFNIKSKAEKNPKNSKHGGIAFNKSAKRKTKKPLIVLSDDEDISLHDDFQDLPDFYTKRSAAKVLNPSVSSISDSQENRTSPVLSNKRNRLSLIPHGMEPTSNLLSTDPIVVDESEHEHTDCASGTKFSLEDSPLSCNLSVLELPTEEASTAKSKSSKPKRDIWLNPPADVVQSISFDVFNVNVPSTSKKGFARGTPKCFKLYDSDNENDSDHRINARKKFSNHDNNKCDLPLESRLFSVLEDAIDNHVTKQVKLSQRASLKVLPPACTFKRSIGCIESTGLLSSSGSILKASVSVNTPRSTVLPEARQSCQHTVPRMDQNSKCFDVSADMFTPEFDLNFDLGFDHSCSNDVKSKKVSSECTDHQNFGKAVKAKPFFGNDLINVTVSEKIANVNKHLNKEGLYSPNRKAVCSKPTTPLSPISKETFNLSQTKRLENQVFFSDFTCTARRSPPCAKVKPQFQATNENSEDSCPIIAGSPYQDKPCFSGFNGKQNSRKRNSPFSIKPEQRDSDDDDFQCVDHLVSMSNAKKLRRSTEFESQ